MLHRVRMRILFITATRIGDAVLSTGLLDHLLRTHPEAHFTIACGPVAEGVFACMPRRDATLVVDKQRFDLHWLRLWRHTIGTLWDLVVDLRGSALSFFLVARRRAVMRGGRRPGHKLAQLAAALGLSTPPQPVSWTGAEEAALADTLLPPQGRYIGLGPTANWSGKAWPAERFAALFCTVRDRALPGARPVVFAGPGSAERALAAPVLAALPDAIDLTGRLSLAEASACLSRCALFVGNDSGLMHLAAAARHPLPNTLRLAGIPRWRSHRELPAPRRWTGCRSTLPSRPPSGCCGVEGRPCHGWRPCRWR